MLGGFHILFGAALAAAPGFRAEVEVRGAQVALGDVLDVARLPATLRARAADLPVATLPAGRRDATVATATLATRARTQMPALAPWLPTDSDKASVTVRRTDAPTHDIAAAALPCHRLLAPLSAGAFPTAADLSPATCETQPRAAFVYDRPTGALRALRDLRAGETVPTAPAYALAAVRPGDRVRLTARVGVVSLEREVTVVRAAAPGRGVLVRGAAGPVFTAPASEGRP